ncbi:MAG: nitroreductase family protein [Anaerolineaceae bacterium]|nr:nitroreductase family protein [Anaerolineaceae bacterium]
MIENEVLNAIKNRRSIRSYVPGQISQDELDAILEAGIFAATGVNLQPWHFTVIQKKEVIDDISEKTIGVMKQSSDPNTVALAMRSEHLFYHAPTVILVSGKIGAYSSLTDCSAAIQNMLVAAQSLNIGSTWIGSISHFATLEDEVKKLNLPEGYKLYYAVCFGHKNPAVQVSAPPRNRDVVEYIR